MNTSIILGLLQNTAILLAFAMLYDFFLSKDIESRGLFSRIASGLAVGGFAIVLILTPWTYVPGLVFDTRSVILSVSGLFLGPLPTIMAMLITGIYRFQLGGPGAAMGIAVIVSSGTIGMLWRKYRAGWYEKNNVLELLGMGLSVHLVMLCCTFLLPAEMILPTIKTIAIPVMVIYPFATILLGILMIKRMKNRETRKALAESEERWKFALEGAGDGLWDWNPQTGEVFYSARWKAMLGYEDHEIRNHVDEWDQRIHPDDRENAYRDLEKYVKGESDSYNNIHRLRCKDGTYKWILDRGKIVNRNNLGEPTRFIGTHTDISHSKLVEAELSAARDRAEESDRLKMSFLNNISHEVRTPLNAIMGFSELLIEENDPLLREKYNRVISANSEQLLGIINDVLEFSRLESEKISFEQQFFSLNELFQDLLETMQPNASRKGLVLETQDPAAVSNADYLGDRNKIRQVMISFISNAIKYTPSGCITIGWESRDGTIKFFVRDTGIGIDPEHQKKIFERFYRAPSAQKMAVRGTGLGLSIARHLVEMMEGSIGVKSNHPKGCEFFMLLPDAGAVQSPGPLQEKKQEITLSGINVLVAEDEDANFELLEIILTQKVKKIRRAHSGEEVMDSVNTTKPDIILMDLKMPDMDGYEATRRVKEIYPDLPVIALTAYSQSEEKKLAAESGCNYFLSKPIKKELLLATIGKAIMAVNQKL